MSACPACGHEYLVGARFCSSCGAALDDPAEPSRQERKVVTVLFADLVGFTSRAERLDPEDVRALLSPYYARVRTELERHGGTVEKFIGDAVMALFGAPVAHEDDPERAVRAALAIRDWAVEVEDGLQLRIAVHTGEALVALGARPSEGEGMASGDVVNTAARLQAAAPVNGVLVSETTHRATAHVIDYRPADPVLARGKAEPVAVWEAVQARARFGVDVAPPTRVAMVGRVHELEALTGALARAVRERSPQLVTIVGVPGIGKSRIVAELFRTVERDPSQLVLWRQGRSLPYGDGVTLWALAEVVKAQAGILETDSPDAVEQRLATAVGDLIADPAEARWVEGHLRPLAGLGAATELRGDQQDEAFAAWRRFFEGLAETNPVVLVFEDAQWADDALLDFIEHLVDWAAGVPILVVCTARPELLEHRSGWGGGKRNATTLSLSPLSDEETAVLIASLSERPVLLADLQQDVLARAGGNPLYTEHYVRMLAEGSGGGDLPLPETIQGIIAARLDALPLDEKRLLQDAAVIGKVFWLGALLALGASDRRGAERSLHALERKEFVRRDRRPAVGGEAQYAFLHVLVRDVAYGQIPRADRADKHRRAAEWIESLGRAEDHAEMLAHHYLSALDLRRAAGKPPDRMLEQRALDRLREAGVRAMSLNAPASAVGFYQAALELADQGSLEHAQLRFRLMRAKYVTGHVQPDDLVATVVEELTAAGDREMAAQAEALLAEMWWERGRRDRVFEHLENAQRLLGTDGAPAARAYVLARVSRFRMLAGEYPEAIRQGLQAVGLADQLGLEDVRAHALNNVGTARLMSGDQAGVRDIEESIAAATAANAPYELCRALGNLAPNAWVQGHLHRARDHWAAAMETATRFGVAYMERWFRANGPQILYPLGHWDEALAEANAFLAEVEAGSPHYLASSCYSVRAQVRLARGDVSGATADSEHALELARASVDPQTVLPVLAHTAGVRLETGDRDGAAALAEEFLSHLQTGQRGGFGIVAVHQLAWTLRAMGRGPDLVEALTPLRPEVPWEVAAVHFAQGDLRAAAEVCAATGNVNEEARDRLWLGEALLDEGRRAEAEVELRRALEFYRTVGATRYITRAETLLAASA